jgi:hypothetical protein
VTTKWTLCCVAMVLGGGTLALGADNDAPPAVPNWTARIVEESAEASAPVVQASALTPVAPVAPPVQVAPTVPAAPPAQIPPAMPQAAPAMPRRLVSPAPPMQRLPAESTAHLPNQVRNVVDFYGGNTSARALAQLPQRPTGSGVSAPPAVRQQIKPFQGRVTAAPTISPYLNLFIEESNEALPNYFAYVRPALDQAQVNNTAERQIHNLQYQVRAASYSAPQPQSGVPGTGHGTHYNNTARYYQPIRKLR